jgi:molecular chaperone GrpE
MTKKDLKAQEGLAPTRDPEVGVDSEETPDAGLDTDPCVESDVGEGADLEAETGIEDGEDSYAGGEEASEAGADSELEADPEPGVDTQPELVPVPDELGRLRDQHLRLAADFENHRKRASADLAGVWARAQAELVRSLVEGLDDLQRVSRFTSEDTTVDALIEGVDLVERNLLKALTEAGLKVLNPEGERFDPNIMEAMMRVPTERDGQDETVHQVFLKGYMFKDQLVRPARVSVYMDED